MYPPLSLFLHIPLTLISLSFLLPLSSLSSLFFLLSTLSSSSLTLPLFLLSPPGSFLSHPLPLLSPPLSPPLFLLSCRHPQTLFSLSLLAPLFLLASPDSGSYPTRTRIPKNPQSVVVRSSFFLLPSPLSPPCPRFSFDSTSGFNLPFSPPPPLALSRSLSLFLALSPPYSLLPWLLHTLTSPLPIAVLSA